MVEREVEIVPFGKEFNSRIIRFFGEDGDEPFLILNADKNTVEVRGDIYKAAENFWDVVTNMAPTYFKERHE